MDDEPTIEQQALGVLIRLDRAAQDRWNRGQNPLAGTGSGDINQAIGMREASNMLRQLLRMPKHPGFKSQPDR